MVESEDYSPTEEAEESYIWGDPVSTTAEKSSSRNDRKRRFSEEQVKSLDQMFESQTKLEPRKKLQLAKELGLHPRQVAIWFQNKRARWKSKQLERGYNALRADYDALLSSFESLKNEKQVLTKQLKKLAELLLDKPMEEREEDQKTNLTISNNTEARLVMSSDDEENKYRILLSEKKAAAEPLGSSLVQIQPEQHFCFRQPSWPPDQTSQWWEFWPMNE